MRKSMIVCVALLVGFLCTGLLTAPEEVQARPQYLEGFMTKYPDLANAAKTTKCGICHPETDKKVRGEYGMAVAGGLNAKNEKDPAAVQSAIEGAEVAKPTGGEQTYGEIIAGGDLPK